MQRIIDTIEKYHMIQPGMRVLAAVSGGADSVCLLMALIRYRSQMEFSLSVVHVEHGLRGEESLADAQYVKELCEALAVPFYLESVDAKRAAKERHLGVEEAARSLRYEAFYKVARQIQADRIAVAHNENDQAETVLWNLTRGSGLQGLGGIRPVREKIIRPLLFLGRQEIEEILRKEGMAWRTDRTNLSCDYTRNRIRLQILPMLAQELNDQAVSHIAQAAERLQEVQDYLIDQCQAAEEACVRQMGAVVYLELAGYGKQHPLLQKEILKHCLDLLRDGMGRKDVGSVHLDALEKLCTQPCGKRCVLPGGMRAERVDRMELPDGEAGEKRPLVRFWQETSEEQQYDRKPEEILLFPGREQQVGMFQVKSELLDPSLVPSAEILQEKKYTKWLSYDTINCNACFRRRRAGDYLVINDRGGRKKLKDYLIDEKIPQKQRDQLWLLADGSHILWIIGWRISEAVKINGNTGKILKIHVEEEIK
ncbi:MAG: tRNA lysidine(34) synthetase TilS [Lachnospiraceae bacterium]|nr:tRNA lysidine(34) synthetase TilS [Lachnospiraceae bacterium]